MSESESDSKHISISSSRDTGMTLASASTSTAPIAPSLHSCMASTAACSSLLLKDLSYTLSHIPGLLPIAKAAPTSPGPSTAVALLLSATNMVLSCWAVNLAVPAQTQSTKTVSSISAGDSEPSWGQWVWLLHLRFGAWPAAAVTA